MNKEQTMVLEFHKKFGITHNNSPTTDVTEKDKWLRYELIEEGLWEHEEATADNNLTAIADALGDLLYVVYGAAVTYGIDMEPIFAEIHRSNMTKEGGTFREDGKLIKPDTYEPPQLKGILNSQKEFIR